MCYCDFYVYLGLVDQYIQFIVPTNCTVLNMCGC